MASCTRIDNLLQAYLDAEIGQSERVILDQHVAECHACAALLRKHQRMSARLFEAFGGVRLRRDLKQAVLDHLPELEPSPPDLVTLNWRAKHPGDWWVRAAKRAPLAVAAVLLLVAVVLKYNWPERPHRVGAIGVVVHAQGTNALIPAGQTARKPVDLRGFVVAGDRYDTGPGSSLMLKLAGPTELKLGANTRIKVSDDRRIALELGKAWFKVGRDGRLFQVTTAFGTVTVFGTAFVVEADSRRTVVTVTEGEVLVENLHQFRVLKSRQQVSVAAGLAPTEPGTVNAKELAAWAEQIVPDRHAGLVFDQSIAPRGESAELTAREGFLVDATKGDKTWAISAIRFYWESDGLSSGHCGYHVYVSDGDLNPLFKGHIPGQVFDDRETQSYELTVPQGPIRNAKVLSIRLVPDLTTGNTETSFRVSALGTFGS